jgi:hypothetical protein
MARPRSRVVSSAWQDEPAEPKTCCAAEAGWRAGGLRTVYSAPVVGNHPAQAQNQISLEHQI